MQRMELQAFIRTIPDFPKPGILFRDITPLLANPEAFRSVLEAMSGWATEAGAGAVVGIESRGFLFGAPLADRLGVPFVPVRKEGKLPAARLTVEYALEYGEARLDIHRDALPAGARAYIVDDVLATGGTALAAAKLVELLGAEVVGMGFLIELEGLGGRERLADYAVRSLLRLEES